ncbi:hypothetical protein GLA29479_1260 [Lysobacter antibioticus]|nr:hypothetical protein GLA29479_1260 [Lysobacter antibioticus]
MPWHADAWPGSVAQTPARSDAARTPRAGVSCTDPGAATSAPHPSEPDAADAIQYAVHYRYPD